MQEGNVGSVVVTDYVTEPPSGYVPEGTFHVHPSGREGNLVFGQTPSAQDYTNEAAANYPGNSFVFGARKNIVTIYNGRGDVATFPLNKFGQHLGVMKLNPIQPIYPKNL